MDGEISKSLLMQQQPTSHGSLSLASATTDGLNLNVISNQQESSEELACTTTMPNGGGTLLSPQRNQSFIAAVISAIRNATTTHSSKKLLVRPNNKRTPLHHAIASGNSNHLSAYKLSQSENKTVNGKY